MGETVELLETAAARIRQDHAGVDAPESRAWMETAGWLEESAGMAGQHEAAPLLRKALTYRAVRVARAYLGLPQEDGPTRPAPHQNTA